jgi:hypothetical protein
VEANGNHQPLITFSILCSVKNPIAPQSHLPRICRELCGRLTMSAPFKVCLTAAGRPRKIIEIQEGDSLEDLYRIGGETFGEDCIDLKSGFPPRSLENSSSIKVRSALPNNDRVTVTLEDAKKRASKKDAPEKAAVELAASNQRGRPKRAAAQAATDSFADLIKAQDKIMKEQAPKRKRPATTAKSSPQKKPSNAAASRKMAKLPGRRLGDGAAVGPPQQQQPAAARRSSHRGPKLGDKEDVSFALMNALDSGGGGKVGQVLRGAMRNAITRQYDASRAVTRVSAVQAGKFTITESSNGSSLVIKFDKGMEGRGELEEIVDSIPREALEAVIKGIHASDSESLRAVTLSQLSPRVFWSLMKETSGHRSVESAMQELLSDLDWTFLRRRKQALSDKAKENMRQERVATGEEEANLELAAEAVQAVEQAMGELHQFDQVQRRKRSAEAAAVRQGDTWCLVIPADEDEDELTECTGGTEFVSNLIAMGIHNWRELANASAADIASKLDRVDEAAVEPWIDRAQEESVEEIIVELCDNRIDVVEILREEARSGTPKDLASWRSMPGMLFETASSLKGIGVCAEDVGMWCQRAYSLLQEYEWLDWYATPVE